MASCDHYPRVPLPLPCSSLFLHESKEGERETNRRRRVLECSPMAESPQQRLRCCWQQVRQCGAFEIRCVEELLFGFQYEHHTVVKRAVVSIHRRRGVPRWWCKESSKETICCVSICCGLVNRNRWFGRSWLVLSAATVKIGSFMCGGMENADLSKEV